MDNRLNIDFGEDKTILFASKRKIKKVPKINITYKNIQIKECSKVTYIAGILDGALSGESMALRVINKRNSRVKFIYRKNKFLVLQR